MIHSAFYFLNDLSAVCSQIAVIQHSLFLKQLFQLQRVLLLRVKLYGFSFRVSEILPILRYTGGIHDLEGYCAGYILLIN